MHPFRVRLAVRAPVPGRRRAGERERRAMV